MTWNGRGSGRLVPSTETCRSAIASSSADCVFGGGAVDLVGEEEAGEDRAGPELEGRGSRGRTRTSR